MPTLNIFSLRVFREMPVKLGRSCIAVLPNGQLMVIGAPSSSVENCSYVYCATFDLKNGNFIITCIFLCTCLLSVA